MGCSMSLACCVLEESKVSLEKQKKQLTENVAKDLPSSHSHPQEDLVLHDQDSDTEQGADEGGIAAPVVKEGLEEGDDGVDVV
jgi:hypothetical protein